MTSPRTARAAGLAITAAALFLLAACSAGDADTPTSAAGTIPPATSAAAMSPADDTPEPMTTDAATTGSGTADGGMTDTAESPTDAVTTDAATTDDTGTDAATTDATDATDGGGGASGAADLTKLTSDEMCALMPKAAVADIVGAELGDPDGTAIDGLGVNCIYYEPGGFELVAKGEFQALAYTDAVMVYTMTAGDDAKPEPCSAAGRTAVCVPAHTTQGGFEQGDVLIVQVGAESDPPLFVETSAGPEAAVALAELILGNLPS